MSKDSSTKYYWKTRLQKKPMKGIRSLWREKQKKQKYGCEQYKNVHEGEKQRLVEYKKKIL